MRFLFGLIGCGLFIAGILMGGSLALFFNWPSIIIVLGGTVFFSLAHHEFGDIMAACGAACGSEPCSAADANRHAAVFSTMRMVAIGSGLVGTLIGLVCMLANMDDPKSIGPAMAVALLTALYGVFLSEMCFAPMSNRIVAKAEASSSDGPSPAGVSHGVMVVIPLVLMAFFILLLSFTPG